MAKSVEFLGFRFINDHNDEYTRKVTDVVVAKPIIAMRQANGFIRITGITLHNPLRQSQRERLAYILYRLGKISRDIWEKEHSQNDLLDWQRRFENTAYAAEELGYRLVALKPAKRVQS